MPDTPPLCLGILISGRGTNMLAVVQAIASGRLSAHVGVVISNQPEAPGLALARKQGIPTAVFVPAEFESHEAYETAVRDELVRHKVELVVLAGYMRLVKAVLLAAFPNRMINIHPSLLPAFKGLQAQAQALAYGVKVSGCTVHFVDDSLDGGPIILQQAVPVLDTDTPVSLGQRILKEEHVLLVQAIRLIAAQALALSGRNVTQIQETRL